MLAEHVLSQLSYTPLDLSSASNHLVEVNGFEPMTSCLQSTRSPNWAIPPVRLYFHSWWAREDLNLRPHAYQACALTNWATSPKPDWITQTIQNASASITQTSVAERDMLTAPPMHKHIRNWQTAPLPIHKQRTFYSEHSKSISKTN